MRVHLGKRTHAHARCSNLLERYVRSGRYEICIPDPRPCDFQSQSLTIDGGTHTHMQQDHGRTEAFFKEIRRQAPGKVVLDVGTGPAALFAVEAARAGATLVYAVEANPVSVARARAHVGGLVRIGELCEGQVVFVEKFSTDLCAADLPVPVDVVVHELLGKPMHARAHTYPCVSSQPLCGRIHSRVPLLTLTHGHCAPFLFWRAFTGHFAGSEGVAHFFDDLTTRKVLPQGCVSIPHQALSVLAPGSAPSLALLGNVADKHTLIGPGQKYLVVGRGGGESLAPLLQTRAFSWRREGIDQSLRSLLLGSACLKRNAGSALTNAVYANWRAGVCLCGPWRVPQGLPHELLLAAPQPFEDLLFNNDSDTGGISNAPTSSCQQALGSGKTSSSSLCFTAVYAGEFDGWWAWMRFAAGSSQGDQGLDWVDSFNGVGGQSTSWQVFFIPAAKPRKVEAGDVLPAWSRVHVQAGQPLLAAGSANPGGHSTNPTNIDGSATLVSDTAAVTNASAGTSFSTGDGGKKNKVSARGGDVPDIGYTFWFPDGKHVEGNGDGATATARHGADADGDGGGGRNGTGARRHCVTLTLPELYPLTGGAWCVVCSGTTQSAQDQEHRWCTCRTCGGAYHRACVVEKGCENMSSLWWRGQWSCGSCR